MQWIKKHLTTIIIVLVLIVGAGLLAYPSFSDWWNSFHQSRAVTSYLDTVSSMDTAEYERIIKEAEAYNSDLSDTGIRWIMEDEELAVYEEMLKVNDSGIMGYIDIPKINVHLPIYHGVDEAVLQVAIGHIEGSSLPVGGKGSHCIVSGHRGLPSAKLFTDLDKMEKEDTFTITVLNRTLTYEVDRIRIVEPEDLSELKIEQGKDYFTLVTCTPYGINTHRLLVRGHRVANAQGDVLVVADATQIESIYIAPFIAAPLLVLLIIAMLIATGIRKRSREAIEK